MQSLKLQVLKLGKNVEELKLKLVSVRMLSLVKFLVGLLANNFQKITHIILNQAKSEDTISNAEKDQNIQLVSVLC